MSQSCSNKIISLHLQQCNKTCSNASVCYHLKKNITNRLITRVDRELLLNNSEYKIHEAICGNLTRKHIKYLEKYKNYNITISSNDISDLNLDKIQSLVEFKDQVQVSIYTLDHIYNWTDWQKLFLIKDLETYNLICNTFTIYNTGKLHLILDQEFVKNNIKIIPEIIKKNNEKTNSNVSIDTCLTSWVVNGHCPYDQNNYIDITYDGTIRKCPYSKLGIQFPTNGFIDDLFELKLPEQNCIYNEIFKGIINGNKSTDFQDRSTNTGNSSSSKCIRRFTLRS